MQPVNISEIFYSIQGESTYAGLPCVFIRLAGCNLRCNYCDAAYTWEKGEAMEIDTIVRMVDQYPSGLVEITGGEPLIQSSCTELISTLLEHKKSILLESNGSIPINTLPGKVIVILDVKCPDSGSADSFNMDNVSYIKQRLQKYPGTCELKFVLSSKNDYLWAREFINQHELTGQIPILFSPVQDKVNPRKLADWLMEDGLQVRLQLQLHTILWPEISRGV